MNEDVLKQPIPAQESLAKEEVSKLNDIHRQLQDQEATLKAQHADADQLIKLKEEQVKLLRLRLNNNSICLTLDMMKKLVHSELAFYLLRIYMFKITTT